jgi:hypothetical protein
LSINHVTFAALVSSSGIGVGSNVHTNVTGKNGDQGTNEEGNSGVWEVRWRVLSINLMLVNSETDDDSEGRAEKSKVGVFSPKELVCTLSINSFNFEEIGTAFLSFSSISIITTLFIFIEACATFSSEEILNRLGVFNLNGPDKDYINDTPDNGCY